MNILNVAPSELYHYCTLKALHFNEDTMMKCVLTRLWFLFLDKGMKRYFSYNNLSQFHKSFSFMTEPFELSMLIKTNKQKIWRTGVATSTNNIISQTKGNHFYSNCLCPLVYLAGKLSAWQTVLRKIGPQNA